MHRVGVAVGVEVHEVAVGGFLRLSQDALDLLEGAERAQFETALLRNPELQSPVRDLREAGARLTHTAPAAQPQALAQQAIDNAARTQGQLHGPAQRMFDSACASCHHDGNGPTLLGVNTPLALNSSLTSTRPDNLLRTILDGVRAPAHRDIGFMPAFREALDDGQIADLAGYMRARFAPQEAPWANLPAEVARVRATPGH